MTRAQALSVSVIVGFLILGLISVVILLIFPYDQFLAPLPTATYTATPSPTLTPRRFLPTPGAETPTPGEPTPTNTRLPTATPVVPNTATPTVLIELPTPYVRPTATPIPAVVPPTATFTPTPTRVPGRNYTVLFQAESTSISNGDCTTLEWRVDGPVTIWLDDRPVGRVGEQEICPERTTDYILEIQVEGSAGIERQVVTVDVD